MFAKHETVARVCTLLNEDDLLGAAGVFQQEYPFTPVETVERQYGDKEALRVFLRDGFVDRYSGTRLVFPGTLRVLADRLPVEFPYHPNWKMTATHLAFWELSPTVDHVVPIARGGTDSEDNWVTTSMLRNSAKANWTLEELGWTLHPPGDLHVWDGLFTWFRSYVAKHPDLFLKVKSNTVFARLEVLADKNDRLHVWRGPNSTRSASGWLHSLLPWHISRGNHPAAIRVAGAAVAAQLSGRTVSRTTHAMCIVLSRLEKRSVAK